MKNIIEVHNLKYKYDNDAEEYILNDVTFHVKQGEWLSIVGHNGSGKSTTIRLIDGLLEAESGEIFILGDQLTPENVWEKRRHIGMVFQNPDNQFVGATVEDDVAFGLENQGMDLETMVERVNEALEIVGMQDFKNREPARLSGGQKQRVAIAGIVALRPDIIILDEATSSIDSHTEALISKGMDQLMEGRTSFVIAHRLSTIRNADVIMVMDHGEIIERGNHESLMEKQGVYYQLYTGQLDLD